MLYSVECRRLNPQTAMALLLAISQAAVYAWAQCVPAPVAAKVGNVTLTNGQIARAIPLSIGTPETNFAFLPQWYVWVEAIKG